MPGWQPPMAPDVWQPFGLSVAWAVLPVPPGRQQGSQCASNRSGVGAEAEAGNGCAQADLEAVV